MQQIFSADRLQSGQRVLFILDLSLRDFLNAQSYLEAFAGENQNVKIDLWVNSSCRCLFGHRQSFQEKLFAEFLQECGFINTVYFNTCSTRLFKKFYKQACECKYPVIIVLSKCGVYKSIKFAKRLNPLSFIVGPELKIKWFNFIKRRIHKKLSAQIDLNEMPQQLFGESFVIAHRPALVVPRKWITYAKLRFLKWGIDKKGQRFGKVFFINIFDDNGKCRYPLKDVLSMVKELKRSDEWGDMNFILHAPPNKLITVRKFFAKHSVNNMILFSADHNFFQMPSILSLCDMVFSVDGFCADMAKVFNIKFLN